MTRATHFRVRFSPGGRMIRTLRTLNPRVVMSGKKRLIIADDEEVEPEQSNPFSFSEFLRCKEHDQDVDLDQETKNIMSSCPLRQIDVADLTFEHEVRSSFFAEPSLQEEGWAWNRHSTSSLCTEEEDEEETRPEDQHSRVAAENHEGVDEMSLAQPDSSSRRRGCGHTQQLREENTSLRRTIKELQRTSDANKQRALELSEELQQRRQQEEKEARDLESMVQSVEQNLNLMTKRALKAESSVSRLKAEVQQLQVEVESLRVENGHLKAAESQVVMTMRQNAQTAAEYLSKTASHAHSSLRRLLEEAETLRLASELLQSIDRISNLHEQS